METIETPSCLLIADSGGSKTDWILCTRSKSESLQTMGLNPSLIGPETIRQVLREQVKPWLKSCETVFQPHSLHFFGAGLTQKTPKARMRKLLKTQLGFSGKVAVEPDILGAAYACLGHEKGVIGILGTGSVAFRYNSKKITSKKGGLGYLIGDVGGGVALGRVFLRRLVNRDLPEALLKAYPEFSGISINAVLETLYTHAAPARFLAAQVPFIAHYQEDEALDRILYDQFQGFLEVYLGSLLRKTSEPVVFMGGVARTFEKQLMQVSSDRGLTGALVYREPPIEGVSNFLIEKLM